MSGAASLTAVKALLFERKEAKYVAAAVASRFVPGGGASVGPLSLTDVDEPVLPSDDWVRVSPRLTGICGSDLATVEGRSSRYFEPHVSFPFIPGHEVVGELDDGVRVALEPVLGPAARTGKAEALRPETLTTTRTSSAMSSSRASRSATAAPPVVAGDNNSSPTEISSTRSTRRSATKPRS